MHQSWGFKTSCGIPGLRDGVPQEDGVSGVAVVGPPDFSTYNIMMVSDHKEFHQWKIEDRQWKIRCEMIMIDCDIDGTDPPET